MIDPAQLKAICEAIVLGIPAQDSVLSAEEFQQIHDAAQHLRKQAVQDVIDSINKGKIRVYKTTED